MSQREKDTAFLRTLLSCHGDAECDDLRTRIREHQRNERATRRAVFLVCILALGSLSGFGYSALFHPEILQNPSHAFFRIFAVAGLASVICLVSYLIYWAHCRALLNNIHDECRSFLVSSLPEKLSAPRVLPLPRRARSPDNRVYQSQTLASTEDTKLIPLPRVS